MVVGPLTLGGGKQYNLPMKQFLFFRKFLLKNFSKKIELPEKNILLLGK